MQIQNITDYKHEGVLLLGVQRVLILCPPRAVPRLIRVGRSVTLIMIREDSWATQLKRLPERAGCLRNTK